MKFSAKEADAVGYRLKLRPSAVLALPRAEVDALVREGDGAAALLYLYLASAAAPLEDAELCRALHWDRAALDAADVQNSVAWRKDYRGRTEQEGGNDRGL